MAVEFFAERFSRFYARENPKCVSEYLSKGFCGIRVEGFGIVGGKQIEETVNIILVDEISIFLCAEKLSEVEGFLFIAVITHQSS